MTRMFAAASAAALMALAQPAAAQDAASPYAAVLGSWQMTMESPRGTVTIELVFAAKDGKLTGTSNSQMGSTELTDVVFDNGRLTFKVVRTFNERTVTSEYAATVTGDKMEGTITSPRGERPFTAMRKAG